ncbi:DUF6457 domain-containing protein [Nesterenkonia alba]|uniref:DUF6457 domain-containing protein n=1 Tax=Nesterenkonia alba TaxID=515814 RepID=UPI0003B693CB|nr:DUF6457 domain-containing protein [Nesterenkonia alba]
MAEPLDHESAENEDTAENSGAEPTEAERTREAIELWVEELKEHLEIPETQIDIDTLLKFAGVAAHTVVRPAAPVSTYVIGYVTGLAVASGQADYHTAFAAATRVADNLLKHRQQAEG